MSEYWPRASTSSLSILDTEKEMISSFFGPREAQPLLESHLPHKEDMRCLRISAGRQVLL